MIRWNIRKFLSGSSDTDAGYPKMFDETRPPIPGWNIRKFLSGTGETQDVGYPKLISSSRAVGIGWSIRKFLDKTRILSRPMNFEIINKTSTTMTMQWTGIPSDWEVDKISLYHKGDRSDERGSETNWVLAAKVNKTPNTYTDTNLLPGKFHQYRFVVIRTDGSSSEPLDDSDYTKPQGAWDAGLTAANVGYENQASASFWKGTITSDAYWASKGYNVHIGDPIPKWPLPRNDYRNITVEFYLNPKSGGVIFRRRAVRYLSAADLYISLTDNGRFRVGWNSQAREAYFTDFSTPVAFNETHHWAITISGGSQKNTKSLFELFRDGVKVETIGVFHGEGGPFGGPKPSLIPTVFDRITGGLGSGADFTSFAIMAGSYNTPYGGRSMNAVIDEFRLWSRVLSDGEIYRRYQGIIRSKPDLICRFGFDNFENETPPSTSEFIDLGRTALSSMFDLKIERRIVEPLADLIIVPVIPILISPGDGSTVDYRNVLFTWGIDSYWVSFQLQVATDSGFQSLVLDVTGIDRTYYRSAILDAFITYYWRVRAYDGITYGPWSTPFSFTTGDYIVLTEDCEFVTFILGPDAPSMDVLTETCRFVTYIIGPDAPSMNTLTESLSLTYTVT